MNILVVTKYYNLSKFAGGPVKSLKNLVSSIEDTVKIFVYTESKDVKATQRYANITVNKWMNLNNHLVMYVDRAKIIDCLRIINGKNIETVYINSIFSQTSYIYFLFIKLYRDINFILAPRGELNVNALRIKKVKKQLFIKLLKISKIEKNVIFHATSSIELKDIKYHFPNASCVMIPNLPSLNMDIEKRKEKIKGKLKIILIARVSKMKNIKFALNTLSSVNIGEVIFDIYGPIEDRLYYEECLDVIKDLPDNITVNFKGHIDNDKIPSLLKKYDLFYSPTLGENYGHSIVEAIQHHIPVLISNNTPWLRLDSKKVGKDLSLDSPELFIDYIEELLKLDNDEYLKKFTGFNDFIIDELDVEESIAKYLKLFRGEINE